MATPGYIFGAGTPYKSSAELERERALVDALLNRYDAPKTLGQGLTAIGNAIAARRARGRLEKDEAASRGAGSALAASLFGGDTPVTGPDATPDYPPMEKPSFGQTIMSKLNPAPAPPADTAMAGEPGRPVLPPSPAVGDEPMVDTAQAQPVPQPMATPQQAPAPEAPSLQQLMATVSNPAFEHMQPVQQELVRKMLEQELIKKQGKKPIEVGGRLIDPDTFEVVYEPPAGADGTEYGLQPIITQDDQGKYHLFQASKTGGPPKEMQLPYGWTPQQQFLDTGTGFQPVPKVGIGAGTPIQKNVANEAALKEQGKATGEAAALYDSMTSKMPGLEQVVNQLGDLADKATYTQAGQLYNYGRKELGLDPTESAIARTAYTAMVDNQVLPMLRDTFGAQFTVVEGETLRATLGDPNKTPAEKKAVLKAFIEQKKRNIEAQAKQGNVQVPQGTNLKQKYGLE